MTIVQDEANRINTCNTTLSDFEYSVNQQITDWAYNKRTAPSYAILVQNYWREVHGIEV